MKEWDPERGWVVNKKENKFYSGYHISQEYAPWIMRLDPEDPNSIQSKQHRYSGRRFYNEVLGLFYRGLGKPLLPSDMKMCFRSRLVLFGSLEPPLFSFAGIDWGSGVSSFTVMWIMSKDDLGRWQLIHIRKFPQGDPLEQVRTIGRMLEAFNVKRCVADIGYGAVQVSELQKKYGDRVLGCQYVRQPEKDIQKVEQNLYGKRKGKMMIQADRSFMIEQAIHKIKYKLPNGKVKPRLIIPYADPVDVEWIVDHFCCIEMEETETVSGKQYHTYTHPEGEVDDALHAFIYALLAHEYDTMTPKLVIKSVND
jgi:hypothetical protein